MSATRTSFKKGQSGNPAGKRPGTRHSATMALDELLDGESAAITRAAIDLAKNGHPVALKACLDRIAPARRDRPINFALPAIETPADLPKATNALLVAVASGELTPLEAEALGRVVDVHSRAVEIGDLSERLTRLEAKG